MDVDDRTRFLLGLPALLAACPTGDRLAEATERLPDGVRRDVAWDGRYVTLRLDPPVDVRLLADAWRITRPVGTSGDVHQTRWHLDVGVEEIVTPIGPILTTTTPTSGPWRIRPILAGRPPGPLPGVRAGASPAYDLRETGGSVVELELLPVDDAVGRIAVADHAPLGVAHRGRGRRFGRPGWLARAVARRRQPR